MNKRRKFFQENIRKDVDIKKHIASEFQNEMQNFSKQIEKFVKETTEHLEENEK